MRWSQNWPNILIGTGEQDYASKFNVQGYPTKILLDPDGTILHRSSGESKDFYVEIEKIIKNHNNNYIIRGTVEDSSLNGTTVYMISGNKNDESSYKDSTVISNGKYTFKGNASISECGNIHTKRKNNNESPAIYTTIVLEHGIIEIYTNKNHETFVSGTSLNDAYQRHLNNINAGGDKIDAIRKQLDNHRNGVALLSDKQIAQLHEAADSISKKRFEIDYNGVKANINNPAICNTRLGVAAIHAGSIEKMKELISGANELTKRHPEYKSVVEIIATLERTAIGQPFIDFQMLDPNGKREICTCRLLGKLVWPMPYRNAEYS